MPARKRPAKKKQVGGSLISLLSGLLGGRKRVAKTKRRTVRKPQRGGTSITYPLGIHSGFSNRNIYTLL